MVLYGKSCGDDLIMNEYIKSTCDIFIPVYVKLFNIIFVLVCWNYYLNNKKVDKKDPQNYRPITILSCMGKLFTSVLNFRLNNFLENYLLLHENQFGFRKEYSTIGRIFALHLIIELLRLKQKKTLFCGFIIFAKAFDNVWRPGLCSKLVKHSVNGNMYKKNCKCVQQYKISYC